MKNMARLFLMAFPFVIGASTAIAADPAQVFHILCHSADSGLAAVEKLHDDLHMGSQGKLAIPKHPGYTLITGYEAITPFEGPVEGEQGNFAAYMPVTLAKPAHH